MWQFIKSSPWTWAVAGVILILAAIGIIVGVVTKGRWKDRGFMVRDGNRLCWEVNAFPIGVILHGDLSRSIIEIIKDVTNKFSVVIKNRNLFLITELMVPKFDWASFPPDGYISIVLGPGIGSSKGITEHHYVRENGRILSAKITIPAIYNKDTLDRIITHEFGHALGLDHDESVMSIMHPLIKNRPQKLTPHDTKLLRTTYEK
jgi:hypothetical protein